MEENKTYTAITNKPETTYASAPQGQYIPQPQQPIYNPQIQYSQVPVDNCPPVVSQPLKPEKTTAGLAFNIASMAIGIITFLYGIISITNTIEYIYDVDAWYSFGSELSTCVGCLIFGLLGLAFAFIGVRKKTNAGRSMGAVGIICGGLGILCSAVSILLLAINF